jgi:hypothetical protein
MPTARSTGENTHLVLARLSLNRRNDLVVSAAQGRQPSAQSRQYARRRGKSAEVKWLEIGSD